MKRLLGFICVIGLAQMLFLASAETLEHSITYEREDSSEFKDWEAIKAVLDDDLIDEIETPYIKTTWAYLLRLHKRLELLEEARRRNEGPLDIWGQPIDPATSERFSEPVPSYPRSNASTGMDGSNGGGSR